MKFVGRKSSTRQVSFFDQSSTSHPRWQGGPRTHSISCQPEHQDKKCIPLPPLPVSAESLSKLQKFQYRPQTQTTMSAVNTHQPMDNEKENTHVHGKVTTANVDATPNHQFLSQKSAKEGSRECPQTPVGRLPLAELIAGGEDKRHERLDFTPMERVLWSHSQQKISGKSSPKNSVSGKGAKRARSSSPIHSPHDDKIRLAGADQSLDLQPLQTYLKTPQVDPANELWTRYSMRTRFDGHSNEALASLLPSSSPQTPARHFRGRELGGLRRSYSCGIEWPTSISKRRKVLCNTKVNDALSSTDPEKRAEGNAKMSRVRLLVEEIQYRLIRPEKYEDEDASGLTDSSPLPSIAKFNKARPTTSPLCESKSDSSRHCVSDQAASSVSYREGSSDFDDDELDFSMLQTICEKGEPDSTIVAPVTVSTVQKSSQDENGVLQKRDILDSTRATKGLTKASLSPHKGAEFQVMPIQSCKSGPPSLSQEAMLKENEFDDGHSYSSARLEDFLAQYDTNSQGHSHNVQSTIRQVGLAKSGPPKSGSEEKSDDEFDNDFEFENIIAEYEESTRNRHTATQRKSPTGGYAPPMQRYLVEKVVDGHYDTASGHQQVEKMLLVQKEGAKLTQIISLRGSWIESPCVPGSIVHLIGEFDHRGLCVVDDSQNLIIINPDHLISATVVADSFSCTRRAVLQDRVKATSQSSESTVYGSILHEIFQEAISTNSWDASELSLIVKKVINRYLESLFELKITFERAYDTILSKAMVFQAWAEIFVKAVPKENAIVKDRNGSQAIMSVNRLLDVEEKIWSPIYGLKGMIDATVQVVMKDGCDERTLTVPLELKTGKFSNPAHKAQTALYTLLLSERYDINVMYGILYYTETSEVSRIPVVRHEIIHMIMKRNELACYVRDRNELPRMLEDSYLCRKCYAQTPCFLYHKLVDDGDGSTSGMSDKFDALTKHLKPLHQQFFRKWDDLISKEERDTIKLRRELWTMQSSERERLGRCFADVVIDHESTVEQEDAPKINRFHYVFMKPAGAGPDYSFTQSQIVAGEPIVISDENGHFALASGYATHVRKDRVQVVVDRRLHNARTRESSFNPVHNQVFTGIMEIGSEAQLVTRAPRQSESVVRYRIDKDEYSNGMATVRNNLLLLMDRDAFAAQTLRKLIVEGAAPTFKPPSTSPIFTRCNIESHLNVDQSRAIEKVMSAKDYALVLGMPGTGKTTTVAHIIRALTLQGKSVLLASYTHSAVDNILLKIREDKIGILRLGAVAKVHPEVQEFTDLAGAPMKTAEDIERSYQRQVVATTCLGINHPIFNQRIFDYCIVDEASQVTLPVCLGPVRMARTFILVGDHHQLPPLVQNKAALEGGLDVSLFKMLSESHPSSVVILEHQYRMCEDILSLSNTLIYNGRLRCGTPAVANRSLTIPCMNDLSTHHYTVDNINSIVSKTACLNFARGFCWIRDLLEPSVKACFVNTDRLLPLSRESESGSRIVNACEADLCAQLVNALLTVGVSAFDIGIITLYRSQLALIKQNLHQQHPRIEMNTADKFQGRDKEVIILSLVRSNEKQNVGDLLKDQRRVNVAFTRAKTKLLVLGSKETIMGNNLLKKFVNLMDDKGWIYDLRKGATEGHIWEATRTQSSPTKPTNKRIPIDSRNDANARSEPKHKLSREKAAKENAQVKGKKRPSKTGTLDIRALLGRRPILQDIVNDAS